MKKRLVVIAGLLSLGAAAGGIGIWTLFRTPGIALPPGVVLRQARLRLTDRETSVDLYVPAGATQAHVAVVAHGFPRSRRNMAGWGAMLAANGFLAAVPDLPTRARHRRNGRAVAELLDLLRAGSIPDLPHTVGRGALLGMSAGGVATLHAAAGNAAVGCWVGLDPVLGGAEGRRSAAALSIPCAVLRAEPAPWNEHGSAKSIAEAVRGPLVSLRVKGATHCDAEWPANRIGELACGRTDPSRGAVFHHYALAAVRAALADDAGARDRLHAAGADDRVAGVLVSDLDSFRPTGP